MGQFLKVLLDEDNIYIELTYICFVYLTWYYRTN